jgi:hypothetical protein
MTDTTSEDFWRPFGEAQWKEFADTVQASDLQLRFSCARFNGASAAAAAKIAGYSGDHGAIRRAGYQAVRSAAVVALLDLAAVNAPEQSALSESEVEAKVAKLVRSPDPQISLKACELFDRRKQRQRELNATKSEESAEEQMAAIITSVPESGAGAFLALSTFRSSTGNLISFPFLAEVAPVIAKNFPTEWQRWRGKERVQWALDFIDKAASGPILEDAELVAAIKRKAPVFGRAQPTAEADNV